MLPRRGRPRTRAARRQNEPQGHGEEVAQEVPVQEVAQEGVQPAQNVQVPDDDDLEEEKDVGRLARLFRRLTRGQPAEPPREVSLLEQIRKAGARNYDGEGDPMMAKRWLSHIEKIYRVVACSSEDRVKYASFLLEGRAETWWESMQEKYGDHDGSVDWKHSRRSSLISSSHSSTATPRGWSSST